MLETVAASAPACPLTVPVKLAPPPCPSTCSAPAASVPLALPVPRSSATRIPGALSPASVTAPFPGNPNSNDPAPGPTGPNRVVPVCVSDTAPAVGSATRSVTVSPVNAPPCSPNDPTADTAIERPETGPVTVKAPALASVNAPLASNPASSVTFVDPDTPNAAAPAADPPSVPAANAPPLCVTVPPLCTESAPPTVNAPANRTEPALLSANAPAFPEPATTTSPDVATESPPPTENAPNTPIALLPSKLALPACSVSVPAASDASPACAIPPALRKSTVPTCPNPSDPPRLTAPPDAVPIRTVSATTPPPPTLPPTA